MKTSPHQLLPLLTGLCLASLPTIKLAAQTAPDSSPPLAASMPADHSQAAESRRESDQIREEAVKLSPFVVATDRDRGYEAENTLSGTRLNTPAKFVGAAVSEVTPALMQDLANFSTEDIINYTTNASSYTNNLALSDSFGNSALFGPFFNIRGFVVSSVSSDFINVRVADDPYNLDRIDVDRGPNSILFGVGSPGGIVNGVRSLAMINQNFYRFGTRVDNWGSHRETFKLNQTLLKDKVAIMLAGVDEDKEVDIQPSDWKNQRLYGTITIKPFKNTTIRGSFDHGHTYDVLYSPWAAGDGLGAWVDAGRQPMPSAALNGGIRNATGTSLPPAATQTAILNQVTAAGYAPISVYNSAGPLQVIGGAGNTGLLDKFGLIETAGRTVGVAKMTMPTLLDSPVPYTTNVNGANHNRVQAFQNYTGSIDQTLFNSLFIQGLFNRQHTVSYVNNAANSNQGVIRYDMNPTVVTANGSVITNPNYQRYFVEDDNGEQMQKQAYDDDTARLQLAYEFDFRDHLKGTWGDILGHLNAGGVRQRVSSEAYSVVFNTTNTTPKAFVGVMPQYVAPAAMGIGFPYIHYFNPGATSGTPDMYELISSISPTGSNILSAGSPLPAASPSGLTQDWSMSSSTKATTITNSQAAFLQNYFWDDRIVTTYGWRKDVVDTWSIPTATTTYNGQTGWNLDVAGISPYSGDQFHKVTNYEQAGITQTLGIVFYPVKWLGLFYNQSSNFTPFTGGATFNILGQPNQPSHGKGRDWGLKLPVWGDKIFLTLDRYTTLQDNSTTSIFKGFAGANPANGLIPLSNDIKTAMQNYAPNDPTFFGSYPFIDSTVAWGSVADNWAQGFEATLTANPTANWRILASFSKQQNVSSNYGQAETQWYNIEKAYITSKYPQDLNMPITQPNPVGGYAGQETIQNIFDNVASYLSQAQSFSGKTNTRQAEYAAKVVMAYDFTTGFLKDFGVGGSFLWQSRRAIGYGFIPGSTAVFDPKNVFWGGSPEPLGLFVYRNFMIGHWAQVHLQINADGVNLSKKLYPYTATDDGTGHAAIVQYAVGPGTTWSFSTGFNF